MANEGIKELSENIYALAKTDGLMAFQPGTKRLRTLTEVEWRYLHKSGTILTEGVGKLEYAVYLKTMAKYNNQLLSEVISEEICSKNLQRQILNETKSLIKKQKLLEDSKSGSEFTFTQRIVKKLTNILS